MNSNNPKLNACIRFLAEILLVLAGITLVSMPDDAHSNKGPKKASNSARKSTGHFGGGESGALVVIENSTARLSFDGKWGSLAEMDQQFSQKNPDQITIKIRGKEWKDLLEWALAHDKTVNIVSEE